MVIYTDYNLKSCNTFGIPATAKIMPVARHEADILQLVKNGFFDEIKLPLVLGGGSNILLTKDEVEKVLKIEIYGIEIVNRTNDYTIVKAGAGVNWQGFVEFTLDYGLYGIENLTLIPGTCGAAPMQNIGAYGVEISDVFDSLEAIHLQTGKKEIFYKEDCEFGYRQSVFKSTCKNEYIISSINLRLRNHFTPVLSYEVLASRLESSGNTNPTARDLSRLVAAIRMEKLPDPAKQGNAGSFFKNPVVDMYQFQEIKKTYCDLPAYFQEDEKVKIPAAWLIERAGLKGFQVGNARVHDRQALVLVNSGKASGNEILELSKLVADSVFSIFNIRLDPEVNIV
ncbi:MAG: UDP-N-acetylmuramate dehydrogenase [Cyclobacteriaceae bacterium]|nr:UDP-N-acetylmuramate dehydrogenase [Cyclobacteriaceae bacterium]